MFLKICQTLNFFSKTHFRLKTFFKITIKWVVNYIYIYIYICFPWWNQTWKKNDFSQNFVFLLRAKYKQNNIGKLHEIRLLICLIKIKSNPRCWWNFLIYVMSNSSCNKLLKQKDKIKSWNPMKNFNTCHE